MKYYIIISINIYLSPYLNNTNNNLDKNIQIINKYITKGLPSIILPLIKILIENDYPDPLKIISCEIIYIILSKYDYNEGYNLFFKLINVLLLILE